MALGGDCVEEINVNDQSCQSFSRCGEKRAIGEGYWKILEHNKISHSIPVTIKGTTHYLCARCTGKYIGIISGMFLFFYLNILDYITTSPFQLFVLSWLFATPSILDWSTAKLGFWRGDNTMRFITGVFMGIGISCFLYIPFSNIFIRIILLYVFSLSVVVPVKLYTNKKRDFSTEIKNWWHIPYHLNPQSQMWKLNIGNSGQRLPPPQLLNRKSQQRQTSQSSCCDCNPCEDDCWCCCCLGVAGLMVMYGGGSG